MNTPDTYERDIWDETFDVTVNVRGEKRSLRVFLKNTDLIVKLNDIQLEFWDVDSSTDAPRMHVFLSKLLHSVSREERQERMKQWARTIGELDMLMGPEAGKVHPREQLANLLDLGQIPRPKFVVLAGANKSLRRLYQALDFPMHKGAFRVAWDAFVRVTTSGEFVSKWKELKDLSNNITYDS